MSEILNSRLAGRSFLDDIGQVVTVVEGMSGLAPGYVTVLYESGRKGNESLYYVLSRLETEDPDFALAFSLLAQAEKIKEHAVALATFAASRELPRGGDLAMIEFAEQMAEVSKHGAEARKSIANELEQDRPPAIPGR